MTDLLSCPFCGAEDIEIFLSDIGFHYVQCKCGVEGPNYKDTARAMKFWNTRALPASGWNFDMAAAPRDGTRILVTAHDEPNDRIYPHIAYFSKDQDAWKSDDDYWIDFDHMTAWQPLPPAPGETV